MAKSWTKNRRCPVCGAAGWGKTKCRGFLHKDGVTVFCENDTALRSLDGYEKTDVVIEPFGIPLRCFRKRLL